MNYKNTFLNTLMILLLIGIAVLGGWILSGRGVDATQNVAESSFYNN